MGKFEDLTGQKFGRLLVVNRAPNKNGRTCWNCLCDCGNEVAVISKSLKDGNTKSCGCLHRELASKQFSKDISNQVFGYLTALEPTEERKHGSVVWKCLCKCGNIHYVTTELLLAGRVKSCGCLHSIGNATIKALLQENQIPYVAEFPIRINNKNYYFDFAIIQNNSPLCFIEYDGILHFKQDTHHGWNNEENWKKTQQNDIIKNNYCKDNNIPLLRIPYYNFNLITINYIQEEILKLCTMDILQL